MYDIRQIRADIYATSIANLAEQQNNVTHEPHTRREHT